MRPSKRFLAVIFLLVSIGFVPSALAPVRPTLARAAAVPGTRSPGHVLHALQQATKEGRNASNGDQQISLTVVLNRSDPAGFDAFAKSHQFAGQVDLSNRFGPSQTAYDGMLAYLRQSGFTLVHGAANRLTLTVLGTRAQTEQALGVQIDDYRLGGRNFYANDVDPALPASIAPYVQAVVGLSNLARPQPNVKSAPATTAAPGVAPAHTPMAIAQAYDFGTVGTNGTGQKIGLAEWDNYSSADVSNWLSWAGLPSSLTNQLSEVNVNGGTTPSGGNGTMEVLLDIDTVVGAAQGAKVTAN